MIWDVIQSTVIIVFAIAMYATIFSSSFEGWMKLSLVLLYGLVEYKYGKFQFLTCPSNQKILSIVLFVVYNVALLIGLSWFDEEHNKRKRKKKEKEKV